MTNSTNTHWSVDGVSLQTHAFNIQTWGGDAQSVPDLRGSDETIPYSPGEQWNPKVPDSRTISFGMWVIGANEDGTLPSEGSSREKFEDHWRKLKKLLWTPGRQVTLTKRFKDYETGEIVTASAKAQFAGGLTPTMNGTQRAQFVVQMKLADPFFYGEEEIIPISMFTRDATNFAPNPTPQLDLTGYHANAGTGGKAKVSRSLGLTSSSFGAVVEFTQAATNVSGGFKYGDSVADFIATVPGQVIKNVIRVTSTVGKTVLPWIQFYNISGTAVGSRVYGSTPVTITPGVWTDVTQTSITVPAGGVFASVGVGIDTVAGATKWVPTKYNYATNPSFQQTGTEIEIARNKFTNPSFEAAGTKIILARNLFINPSISSADGIREVRRNLVLNPSFEGALGITGWKGLSGSTISTSTVSTHGDNSLRVVGTSVTVDYLAANQGTRPQKRGTYNASVKVRAPAGTVITARLRTITTAGAIENTTSTSVTASSGTAWNTLTVSNDQENNNRIPILTISTGTSVTFYVDAAIVTASEDTTYFDRYYETDGDLKYKADAATRPAGGAARYEAVEYYDNVLSATGGTGRVVNRSTSWSLLGTTSMRIMRTGTAIEAAAGAVIKTFTAADVGKTFTVKAYCWTKSTYNSTEDIALGQTRVSRGIYVLSQPGNGQAQAPNTPNTVSLVSATITPTVANTTLMLGGGGTVGQEVFWEMVTIVEGIYTRPPFPSSTSDHTWEGVANKSTSVMNSTRAWNVTTSAGCVVHQSKEWAAEGTVSLAIRRTTTAAAARLGARVGPFPAGKYYVQARCHIPAGYNSTDDIVFDPVGISRGIYVPNKEDAGRVQASTVPGTQLLSVEVDLGATDVIALGGGGAPDQEVFYDLLTVTPVETNVLTTLPFSGNTVIDADMRGRWTGTANRSESVLTAKTVPQIPSVDLSTFPFVPPLAVQSQVWATHGTYSLRAIPRDTRVGSNKVFFPPTWVPEAAGEYTIRVSLYLAAALTEPTGEAGTMTLTALNDEWSGTSSAVANTVGAKTLTWTFTKPEGLLTELFFNIGHSLGDLYFDSFLVTDQAYTGAYFDGSTAGGKWDGVANASTTTVIGDLLRVARIMSTENATSVAYFDGAMADTATHDYGWLGTPYASQSTRAVLDNTPREIEIKGDYDTTSINFVVNSPMTSFSITNTLEEGPVTMKYAAGTPSGTTDIDVKRFKASRAGVRRSAYVDNSGHPFWMVLRPGTNYLTLRGTGTGVIQIKYRPVWL